MGVFDEKDQYWSDRSDLTLVPWSSLIAEFQRILDIVDPNRDGYVTLQEYMAFMISKETENIQSSEEIESAFRALSKEYRPYVTAEELYANLTPEQVGSMELFPYQTKIKSNRG